jgi:hypothetical protein
MTRALGMVVACLVALSGAACTSIWGLKEFPNEVVDGGAKGDASGDAATDARADAAREGGQDAGADIGSSDAPTDSTAANPDDSGSNPDALNPPDGGGDLDANPDCTNPCTEGTSQCMLGGVQTCQKQPDSCLAWVMTSTCADNQTCSIVDSKASCACPPTICTKPGAVCQDGQTVATCAMDGASCLYVKSTLPCTAPMSCAGDAPTAACSSTCTNTCTAGQTSCVNGGLATCTKGANGCYALSAPVACGAHQSCTGASGAAKCGCNQDVTCTGAGTTCASKSLLSTCTLDAQGCVFQSMSATCTGGACTGTAGTATCCTNACTAGATQCMSGAVQTCQAQPNGCTAWATTKTCGAHQTCTVSGAVAACTCSASICTAAGTTCQNAQTVATCAADADSCLYVMSTATCTAPESCAGAAPTAKCSLTCTNTCSPGQKTCAPGGIATCTLGSNGCYSYPTTGTACQTTHQTCTGAAPNAMCTCNNDPLCGGSAGAKCINSNTASTVCAADAAGCFFQNGAAASCGGTLECHLANSCSGGMCVTGAAQTGTSCSAGNGVCQSGSCCTKTGSCNVGACHVGQLLSCPNNTTKCIDGGNKPDWTSDAACPSPGNSVCRGGVCKNLYFGQCNNTSVNDPNDAKCSGGCYGQICIGTVGADGAGRVTCVAGGESPPCVCSATGGCHSDNDNTCGCGGGNGGSHITATCDGPADCSGGKICCATNQSGNVQNFCSAPANCPAGTSSGGVDWYLMCDPFNPQCPTGQICNAGLGQIVSGFVCVPN